MKCVIILNMMYTSFKFLIFALTILVGYYSLPHKFRSFFLVGANLYFCSLLGMKHMMVLVISIVLSFGWAKLIEKTKNQRLCLAGVGAVVLSLFYVKFGTVFGFESIFVPVGYSFYGLQMISFLMDVNRGKIESIGFMDYVQYMSFFPILLQGPICRYDEMQKQFQKEARFDFQAVKAGGMLVMFGMFKKLVIADRLAVFVQDVFAGYADKSGGVMLIGVLFYAFQLYSDFSGCTDISRGVSECLALQLPNNFRNPYFALSVKQFWNRWHISLSTWLKDYVYIPLGGNRKGNVRKYINLALTFLVSGLWHGTGLQYIVWGLLQAVGQISESFVERSVSLYRRKELLFVQLIRRLYVAVFTLGSWLVFRSYGVRAAVLMLIRILTRFWDFTGVLSCGLDQMDLTLSFVLIGLLMGVDVVRECCKDIRQKLNDSYYPIQLLVWMILIFGILVFGMYGSGYSAADFIYMQF